MNILSQLSSKIFGQQLYLKIWNKKALHKYLPKGDISACRKQKYLRLILKDVNTNWGIFN